MNSISNNPTSWSVACLLQLLQSRVQQQQQQPFDRKGRAEKAGETCGHLVILRAAAADTSLQLKPVSAGLHREKGS